MTYIPGTNGKISIEGSRRLLRAIFPKYPGLKPCNPVAILEPTAPFLRTLACRSEQNEKPNYRAQKLQS